MSELMLSAEAARVLGVSVPTLHAWAQRGRLAAVRTSTGVRIFLRRDIERLLAERLAARGR